MKIAYLCCSETHSASPSRKSYAFEHDLMVDALRKALSSFDGGELHEVNWDDQDADWADFDAALIGTTWDYWDRQDLFLSQLEKIESQTRLFNSADQVRWNSRKTYLQELAGMDVPTINTVWLEEPTEAAVNAAFDILEAEDIVIKQQIGAGAQGQYRLHKGDKIPELSVPMMAQAFQKSVATEGEYSFLFVNGDLSGALIKRPQSGDYRVQAAYGGQEEPISPSADDLNRATNALSALTELPLYARIDMIRGENGGLLLMEAELIEPYLFPVQVPNIADDMIKGLQKRLLA